MYWVVGGNLASDIVNNILYIRMCVHVNVGKCHITNMYKIKMLTGKLRRKMHEKITHYTLHIHKILNVCMYVRICMYTYVHLLALMSNVCTHIRTYVHTHIYMNEHTHDENMYIGT